MLAQSSKRENIQFSQFHVDSNLWAIIPNWQCTQCNNTSTEVFTRYINLNNSFVTINSVSCKLSSNRAFTPFSGGLQFKSRRSGGLQFLSGTWYSYEVRNDGRTCSNCPSVRLSFAAVLGRDSTTGTWYQVPRVPHGYRKHCTVYQSVTASLEMFFCCCTS